MAHPILRKIGFLSYALYLWHWPIRVFATDARLHLPDNTAGQLAGITVRLFLTFTLAWLSMVLIERWFRMSELGVSKFGLGWLGVGALLVSLALIAAPSAGSTIVTNIGGDQAAQRERNLSIPRDLSSPSVLIAGDSVAITLDHGLRRTLDPSISVISAGELGCALLTSPRALSFDGLWNVNGSECPDHDEYWAELVKTQQPDVIILLIGAWDLYAREWGNGVVVPGDVEFDSRYAAALEASLGVLTSEGADVVLLTTPCFAPAPGETAGPQHDPERARRLGELQRTAVANFADGSSDSTVTLLDLQSITCENGFTAARDGVEWRPDGAHFSVDGARVVARWLVESLPATTRARLGSPGG